MWAKGECSNSEGKYTPLKLYVYGLWLSGGGNCKEKKSTNNYIGTYICTYMVRATVLTWYDTALIPEPTGQWTIRKYISTKG